MADHKYMDAHGRGHWAQDEEDDEDDVDAETEYCTALTQAIHSILSRILAHDQGLVGSDQDDDDDYDENELDLLSGVPLQPGQLRSDVFRSQWRLCADPQPVRLLPVHGRL
jgi:hypothetical protein